MRPIIILSALLLATSAARADIAPPPDHGPTQVTVAGLKFEIGSHRVKMPPGYYKSYPVAVLAGCVENHPNCKLAQAQNVIGAEVQSVDGEPLEAAKGRLRQIVDHFAETKTPVTLEFLRPNAAGAVSVGFAPVTTKVYWP